MGGCAQERRLASFLRTSHLGAAGLLDQRGVNRLVSDHSARRADHAARLWLLGSAEAWFRMRIEGGSPEDVADSSMDG